MLIISRKPGEDIYIGNQLRLIVLEHSSYGEVQLGFEGPREIQIWRGEIYARICRDAELGAPRRPMKGVSTSSQPTLPPHTPFPKGQGQGETDSLPKSFGR